MNWEFVQSDQIGLLAELNLQLQQEEGSVVMEITDIQERLTKWLSDGYNGVLFKHHETILGYVLFRKADGDSEGANSVYIRQFFVVKDRRRKGVGKNMFRILLEKVWPPGVRLILDTMCTNPVGQAFWQSLGFTQYSIKYEYVPHSPSRKNK